MGNVILYISKVDSFISWLTKDERHRLRWHLKTPVYNHQKYYYFRDSNILFKYEHLNATDL